MEIENSALMREIEEIIRSTKKPVHFNWVAQIHIGAEFHQAFRVISIDIERDYEKSFADQVMIKLMLPAGTYAKRIYPARSKLDIVLYRFPLNETGGGIDAEAAVQTQRYTAVMVDRGDPIVEANAMNTPTEESLNLSDMVTIDFQLIDKTVEQLRGASVGGVYRSVSAEDVIKTLLVGASQALTTETVQRPRGVDMVEPNNKTVRTHIVVPHGLKLVELPGHIQQKCGGVYSTGLGYYLQDNYWYVYPCYNTKRLNQSVKTLTLINVPSNKFPSIERTYRVDGNNVVALVTGQVSFRDESDARQLTEGNGVRFSDADKFMDSFAELGENKVVVSRGTSTTEVISAARANGNNNVHLSPDAITANPYAQYSEMAKRNGAVLSMVWESSLQSAVFPGMLVKIMYLDSGEIKTNVGVVLKAHHYIHMRGAGMTSNRHYSNTMLSVFVERSPS